MRQICPAPNSDRAGFTLVESIVAVAVVAVLSAAAASSVLMSARLTDAAGFDVQCVSLLSREQASFYGWLPDEEEAAPPEGMTIERETVVMADDESRIWRKVTIRGARETQTVMLALDIGPAE